MIESTNTDLINKLSSELTDPTEAKKDINTVAPLNTAVELPAGFINADGILIKYAEVRELNGEDEEQLAKASSAGSALNIALTRGVLSLGDEAPTKANFDALLAGDRDTLLLAIRKVTFGKSLDLQVHCGGCEKRVPLVIDLDEDIETVFLDNPITDRTFTVQLKSGSAVVGLPNGVTQKRLIESFDKSTPELVTIILSGCIKSINDDLSMGISTALSLGISDRETLMTEIYKRSPGPRLGEVSKACEVCGTKLSVSFSLADLFRL